jgi:hypothetical protein
MIKTHRMIVEKDGDFIKKIFVVKNKTGLIQGKIMLNYDGGVALYCGDHLKSSGEYITFESAINAMFLELQLSESQLDNWDTERRSHNE